MQPPVIEEILQLDRTISEAVLEIFTILIPMEVTVETTVTGDERIVHADMISMIGLAGEFKGIIAVLCPENVALAMGSAMIGMEITSMDQDIRDAVGEVANMVAGGLKDSLGRQNIKTQITVPTTITGRSIHSSRMAGARRIEVPFETEDGIFSVELKYIFS